MSGHVCGSRNTSTGEPCQTSVSEPGETCWRESHIAGSLGHLTPKQRRFVEEYTGPNLGNATRSAIAAGYSENAAHAIGHENLRKPEIEKAVEDRLDERAMEANEVLARLADMGRGDMEDFIELKGGGDWDLDLEKAKELGLLHLVKEISYDSNGLPKIKLYDASRALEKIGKVHGLFVEKVEHSGEIDTGGEVNVYLPSNDRDQLPEAIRERMAGMTGNGAGPE